MPVREIGEDGVDEDQGVGLGFVRGGDLDAEVEEADAVGELFFGADGLTADRGGCAVVGGRVVGAGDGEGAEGSLVGEVGHPFVEVGAGVKRDVVVLGEEDASEADFGVGG